MPLLTKSAEGAWELPLTARALMKAFAPFTRMDGEQTRLEDVLAVYLVPGSSFWPSSKKPTLPRTKDRITVQLVGKSFTVGVQAVAACTILPSRITTGKTELSGEEIEEALRISGAILHLIQASAVCGREVHGHFGGRRASGAPRAGPALWQPQRRQLPHRQERSSSRRPRGTQKRHRP